MQGGGKLDAPGGYLIGWALTILLLSSTPAVAYFLVRSPVAATALRDPSIASLAVYQNPRLVSSDVSNSVPRYETLVASANMSLSAGLSDVGDAIVATRLPDLGTAPYLMQAPTPQDIPRRGLRLEDFVPNAETLSLTTRVWESYLTFISGFLRG
ncbi:hypothetical protein NUACC21_58310 [Scytonema sp. NUACC21]